IRPVKGEPFTVNGSHILSLVRTQRSNQKYPSSKGGVVVDISVNDYLKKSKTWKHLHKLYRTGVDFPYQPVILDPYILGLWLGDGHSNGVGITTVDFECVNSIKAFAKSMGFGVRKDSVPGKAPSYYVTNGHQSGRGPTTNVFLTALISLNVRNNK